MLDGLQADAACLGLVLEGFDEDEDDPDAIWPENEAALTAFLRVQTQWRYVCPGDGSVRRAGLDYPAVEAALRMAEVAMTSDLFADLQVIEAGVLAAGQSEGWE